MRNLIIPSLPAIPGYYLLCFCNDENCKKYYGPMNFNHFRRCIMSIWYDHGESEILVTFKIFENLDFKELEVKNTNGCFHVVSKKENTLMKVMVDA